MSKTIETAVKATMAAVKAELATGKASPALQQLTQQAIEAAEKVVGKNSGRNTQAKPRRPR